MHNEFKVGDRVRVTGCWYEVKEVRSARYLRHYPNAFFYRLSNDFTYGEGLLTSEADYEAKQAQRKAAAQQRYDDRPDETTLERECQARELKRIAELREIDSCACRGWAG